MPIYEFKCTECYVITEKLLLSTAEIATKAVLCSSCGRLAKKCISVAAIKINDSGRYVSIDDFDDAHKFNIRTTEQRAKDIERARADY